MLRREEDKNDEEESLFALPSYLRYLNPLPAKDRREYAKEPTEPFIVSNIDCVTWTFTNIPDANPSHPDILRYQIWEKTNEIQLMNARRQLEEFIPGAKKFKPSLLSPENRRAQLTCLEPQARQHYRRHAASQVIEMWRQLIDWQQDYIDDGANFQAENAHGRLAGSGWRTDPVNNVVSLKVDPYIRKHTYVRYRGPRNRIYPVLVVALPHPRIERTFMFRPLLPTDVPETLGTSVANAYTLSDNEPPDAWKQLQQKQGIFYGSREEERRLRQKQNEPEKDVLGNFVSDFIDRQLCNKEENKGKSANEPVQKKSRPPHSM
jgi:hypothetical protein